MRNDEWKCSYIIYSLSYIEWDLYFFKCTKIDYVFYKLYINIHQNAHKI